MPPPESGDGVAFGLSVLAGSCGAAVGDNVGDAVGAREHVGHSKSSKDEHATKAPRHCDSRHCMHAADGSEKSVGPHEAAHVKAPHATADSKHTWHEAL